MSKKPKFNTGKSIGNEVPEDMGDTLEGRLSPFLQGTKPFSGGDARQIPIEKIMADPTQPRKTFRKQPLVSLADSIKSMGIAQPLLVEYDEEKKKFIIITGERRFRAAQMAELELVPCIINNDIQGNDRFALQLVENLQREDFRPVEKAVALHKLRKMVIEASDGQKRGSWSKVEEMTGVSERRRQQILGVLKLPKDLQQEVVSSFGGQADEGAVTEKHVRHIIRLPKAKQKEVFGKIREENLTANETAKLVRTFLGSKPEPKTFTVTYSSDKELLRQLKEKVELLEKKVAKPVVRRRRKKGDSQGQESAAKKPEPGSESGNMEQQPSQ